MRDFRLCGERMNDVVLKFQAVQEHLDAACGKAEGLCREIEEEGEWSGEQAKAFLAYMDMLNQYQREFRSVQEEGPAALAGEALAELNRNVNEFYMDFEEYRKLEGME